LPSHPEIEELELCPDGLAEPPMEWVRARAALQVAHPHSRGFGLIAGLVSTDPAVEV
jgi:hypothetical protein